MINPIKYLLDKLRAWAYSQDAEQERRIQEYMREQKPWGGQEADGESGSTEKGQDK